MGNAGGSGGNSGSGASSGGDRTLFLHGMVGGYGSTARQGSSKA